MSPGLLDKEIIIERNAPIPGRFGAEDPVWTQWKVRRARKIEKSGNESSKSGRRIGRQSVTWRFRYTAGLQLTDRIRHGGVIYEIVNSVEIGRRYMMDVECVLHANNRPEGQDAV